MRWILIFISSKQFLKIKIQPYLSEQEKKRQRIYDLFNAEPSQSSTLFRVKKKITEKELFMEWRRRRLNKHGKGGFLTALAMVIKKDSTT